MSHAIELLLALITFSGLIYTTLALLAARSFARTFRHQLSPTLFPAVTLLKPLKGADEELYAALESHCLQQYSGPFEILCGVSSPDDPAARVVAQLQAAYPQVALHLILCPERLGTSGKVSNLVQMLRSVRFDHILINDSDIHVGPQYLAHIMAGFSSPPPNAKQAAQPVGMVTAPYLGRAHPDSHGRIPLWSRLEALGISTEFLPGVLTARMLEGGIHFGLGSTLAMRRDALAAAGGLEPLLEILADDYELGARIARAGFRVELSSEVVETSVPPYTLRGFFDHQLRWSRSTRDSRRLGYLGLGITFVVPWALATCARQRPRPLVARPALTRLRRPHRPRPLGRRRHPARRPGPPRPLAAALARSLRPLLLAVELRRQHRRLARGTLRSSPWSASTGVAPPGLRPLVLYSFAWLLKISLPPFAAIKNAGPSEPLRHLIRLRPQRTPAAAPSTALAASGLSQRSAAHRERTTHTRGSNFARSEYVRHSVANRTRACFRSRTLH